MKISNIIQSGVRGKDERCVCLRTATDGEEIHLKVKKIDGVDYLIIVDAYGPSYGKHFGYESRSEECFRVRLGLVQKYLRFDFDPADFLNSTRGQREKFFRLMGILLDVVDGEKEKVEVEGQLRARLAVALTTNVAVPQNSTGESSETVAASSVLDAKAA